MYIVNFTVYPAVLSACRSLSEVPKGLRPIRTTSGRVVTGGGPDAASLKGFVARLRWARQQSLQQRQGQQQQNPAQAASVQVQLCLIVLLGKEFLLASCSNIYVVTV